MHAPRADRGYLWLLALFTTAGLLEAALWGQINAFVPLYLPSLGVASHDVARWTGIATVAGTAVGIPTLPLWGALADRYARQPVIVRSFVVYVLGCGLAALAHGMALFIVGRTLMSLSMGNSGLMMTTLAERAPVERRRLAFAVFNSAPPLGAFIGPLVGGPLADRVGVRGLLATDAAIMLGVTLALGYGYRDTYAPTSTRSVWSLAAGSLGALVGSSRLRRTFVAMFALFSGWMLVNLYLPLVVAGRFPCAHLATRIGWVLASGGVGTVLLAPSLGALADRVGLFRVLCVAAALEAALWPVVGATSRLGPFVLGWAVGNGLASAVFALSFSALSDACSSDTRARVMAFAFLPSTAGYGIASAVGTALGGRVEAALFDVAALLTALGCVGAVWARRGTIAAARDLD